METKPFSLQSPEQIAKDYGGNKQKIAEAMQMGIVDPTAGTLAGMFIDRMRGAAQAEAVPQQTVAQQVFAPPQPQMPMGAPPAPAGLGATPQAAAMPALAAAPPMGMPAPPMGMPAPEAAPPMGMAMGGLTSLPVPDSMFDEPSNGGYRGGGIVAFGEGDLVDAAADTNRQEEEAAEAASGDIVALNRKTPSTDPRVLPSFTFEAPDSIGQNFNQDVLRQLDLLNQESPRETKRAEQLQAYLDRVLDPEAQKSRAKDDFMAAIGKLGARMASTPGSLLQAFNVGAAEAIPDMEAAAKERRAEEQATVRELAGEERVSNKEILERFNMTLDAVIKGIIPLEEAFKDRNFQYLFKRMDDATQRYSIQQNAAASRFNALTNKEAALGSAGIGYQRDILRANSEAGKLTRDFLSSGLGAADYAAAIKEKRGPQFLQQTYNSFGGIGSFVNNTPAPAPAAGKVPPPPAGAKLDR